MAGVTTTMTQLHVETGQHEDGTWWARVVRGQRPRAGRWEAVKVGHVQFVGDRATGAGGYQTQAGAATEGVRSWFATAERVGWL